MSLELLPQPNRSSETRLVEVALGDLAITRLPDGRREITAVDEDLLAQIADRLGIPTLRGSWIVDEATCRKAVHEMRRTGSDPIPAPGPAARGTFSYFRMASSWGPLKGALFRTGSIGIKAMRGNPKAAELDEHLAPRHPRVWNSHRVMDKREFDDFVARHWRRDAGPIQRAPQRAIRPVETEATPTGQREPAMVEGHPVMLVDGRETKADRAWYRANRRHSTASCTLGDYDVYVLHDGWMALFCNRKALLERIRDLFGPHKWTPLNAYLSPPASIGEINAALDGNAPPPKAPAQHILL